MVFIGKAGMSMDQRTSRSVHYKSKVTHEIKVMAGGMSATGERGEGKTK